MNIVKLNHVFEAKVYMFGCHVSSVFCFCFCFVYSILSQQCAILYSISQALSVPTVQHITGSLSQVSKGQGLCVFLQILYYLVFTIINMLETRLIVKINFTRMSGI